MTRIRSACVGLALAPRRCHASPHSCPETVLLEAAPPHFCTSDFSMTSQKKSCGKSKILTKRAPYKRPELTIYVELIQILGIGEAACLSLAQCRNWLIASDEQKKFSRETTARPGRGRLLSTPGIRLFGPDDPPTKHHVPRLNLNLTCLSGIFRRKSRTARAYAVWQVGLRSRRAAVRHAVLFCLQQRLPL